jgi:aryl-alcohol dehydrogenase
MGAQDDISDVSVARRSSGGQVMKIDAAVSQEAAGLPRIESLNLEEPRANEILVRIVATGVCHTDLHSHARPGPKPIVLGHEGAGVVERVGSGVTTLAAGDHVVLSFSYCGVCPSCRRHAPSYCYEIMPRNFGGLRPDGTSPLSYAGALVYGRFFGQSSFATYSIAEATSAVKVPKDVPLAMLGPLACGIQTGAGSVINALRVQLGQSLVVIGSGAVGLAAIMAARLVGADRIIAVDVLPERLKLARELGATDVVDAHAHDPIVEIRKMLPYGADFSLVTASGAAAITQAIECLAQQGTAGYVTAPDSVPIPLLAMMKRGLRLRSILTGDSVPQLFIPALIDYWRQGRFPFDRLIRYYSFKAIGQAFADAEKGVTIKPVVTMDGVRAGLPSAH